MGIKLGIYGSHFCFTVQIFTSVKSFQKYIFIYEVLFICYFYDTYLRDSRTLLCFPVCIQLVPKKRSSNILV